MTLIFFLKKKQNLKTFIIFFIIFSFFYFLFENLIASLYIFSTPLFSLFEKINIFFISLFDISILKNITIFILVILFIFSISLMFTFLLSLIKESKKISSGKSLWHVFGIFLSVLGISCVSCGVGFLASILSFFGIASLVTIFPFHGIEFGYLGILFLNISNYFLWKRIKSPYTC